MSCNDKTPCANPKWCTNGGPCDIAKFGQNSKEEKK